jgi:TonB family protein
MTEESSNRAIAAMRPFLQWPRTEAPSAEGLVRLSCSVTEARRLQDCAVESASASSYPLGEAALAFAREVEVCPHEQGRVEFFVTFEMSED